MLDKEIRVSEMKINIAETGENGVKRVLQRYDIFKEKDCEVESCLVYRTDLKGLCKSKTLISDIKCN